METDMQVLIDEVRKMAAITEYILTQQYELVLDAEHARTTEIHAPNRRAEFISGLSKVKGKFNV